MPRRLPELPRTRSISDPANYPPFTSFSCGETHEYELHANEALSNLLNFPPEQLERITFRVAEERRTGDLIGLSAFLKKPLLMEPQPEEWAKAVHIALIAVRDRYRGVRMHDGSRIGVFLLCDALDQIERKWSDPMPAVWASAHRDNEPCKRHLVSTLHRFWQLRIDVLYPVYLRPENEDSTRGFAPATIEAVREADVIGRL